MGMRELKILNLKNIEIVAQQGSERLLISYGNEQGSILFLNENVLSAPMNTSPAVNTASEVGYSFNIHKETFEYRSPKTFRYSGNT
jgi:hypothetical protein